MHVYMYVLTWSVFFSPDPNTISFQVPDWQQRINDKYKLKVTALSTNICLLAESKGAVEKEEFQALALQ